MATDLERNHNLTEERFSSKLWKHHGWKKYRNSFFKGFYVLEFDDIGFWFWDNGYRAAGMAWDSLEGYIKDGKIIFKNDVTLEL